MKNLIAVLSIVILIPFSASELRADDHIEIPPQLEKLLKDHAIKLGDKARRLGLSARDQSQNALSDDWLEACKVALDFCSEKVAACNACIDSWSGGFGLFCWDECGEAAGACEAAGKVCEGGS